MGRVDPLLFPNTSGRHREEKVKTTLFVPSDTFTCRPANRR